MGHEENAILKGYNLLLYFAGSMIMYEPDDECVSDFWEEGILKALPVKSRNPRFIKAASQLRNSCKDKTTCTGRLRQDFNRLLKEIGAPLAPARRSKYLNKKADKNSENISEFYNSYGWKYRSRYNFPDDNLGIELLFLTLLIDKYLTFNDNACRTEMGKEIKRFIEKHILSWIPQWNESMQEYAETTCYKGIATLVYACAEDIYDLLVFTGTGQNLTSTLRN
jgi:TorA maturation chaperone TorD